MILSALKVVVWIPGRIHQNKQYIYTYKHTYIHGLIQIYYWLGEIAPLDKPLRSQGMFKKALRGGSFFRTVMVACPDSS